MVFRRVLHFVVRTEAEVTTAEFSGRISERTAPKFDALLRELEGAKTVHLDLHGISGINSVGVRDWISFIQRCTASASVELHRCSTAVVSQLNMVAGFDGGAAVRSIVLPFLCEACGTDSEVVVDINVDDGEPPAYTAPTCGVHQTPMLFDDLEDAYFAFLTRS